MKGKAVAGWTAAGIAALILLSWVVIRAQAWLTEAAARAVASGAEAAARERPAEREGPILLSVRLGETTRRHQRIEGSVQNDGPGTVYFVRVRCALVARPGSLEADAGITYAVGAEGLPPGNRRPFGLYLGRPVGEASRYRADCRIDRYRKR